MPTLTVKNRRLKVSPGGIITLPVSARKTIGMKPGTGTQVTVAVDGATIAIQPAGGLGGYRVSAKGQLELRGSPRELLETGEGRHFWLELQDEKTLVVVHPWK